MNVPEIERLVELITESRVSEVSIRTATQRITIRKGTGNRRVKAAPKVVEAQVPVMPLGPVTQLVTSPLVGIFQHRSNAVQHGDLLKDGEVVGSIESMKLQNEVRSEFAGFVVEVLVENEQPVEYGQPLFRLESTVSAG